MEIDEDGLLFQLGQLKDWCFEHDKEQRMQELKQCISSRLHENDYYRQGLLLNCSDHYDEQAERLLTREVKLHPDNCGGWQQLGQCLWKKGSKQLAYKCYLRSLSVEKNLPALQELSMLLRQLPQVESAQNFILESVDYAQEAIQLNAHDHKSW